MSAETVQLVVFMPQGETILTVPNTPAMWEKLAGGYAYGIMTNDLPSQVDLPEERSTLSQEENQIVFSWQGFVVQEGDWWFPGVIEYTNGQVVRRQTFGVKCQRLDWARTAVVRLIRDMKSMTERSTEQWMRTIESGILRWRK